MSRFPWAGTVFTTSALLIRAVCQAATFLILARHFEPSVYGGFVALVCVGVLVAPFVTAGIEYVTVSMVATGRATTAQCVGSALQVLAVLAPVGFVVACGYVAVAMEPHMRWLWVCLFLASETLLVPALEIVWRSYQANERMRTVGVLRVLPAVLKLLAALLFVVHIYDASIANWAVAYAAASMLSTVVALWWLWRDFGITPGTLDTAWRAARQGWPFAAYSMAERTTNDVDKLLLASLASTRVAGLYAAAYRLIEVLVMPLMAALMTTNAVIYRAGAIAGTTLRALLLKLSLPLALYGLVVGVVVNLGADFAVSLLGEAYIDSAQSLRALSVLPLCYGLRVLLGFGLAALGRQLARMLVQGAAALTSMLGCLVLIPSYGPLGAAFATIATELLSIAVLLTLLIPGLGRNGPGDRSER